MNHPLNMTERQTATRLQFGFRITVFLTTAVILFGLSLYNIVHHWGIYKSPITQGCTFGLLAITLTIEAVLIIRKRPWGKLQFPAVAIVIFASIMSYVTLPEGHTATYADWMFGAANWIGLIILLDRSLWVIGTFLISHVAVAMANMMISSEVDRALLLRFIEGSISIVGHPTYMAVVVIALRKIAASATAAAWETEKSRTAEAVAVESHRRQQQRFAELNDSTVPLLAGFAQGTFDPENPDVQRRSAIEAARMRRLFAESDVVANPLLHELRHCIDVADVKGVLVELNTSGQWPDLPLAIRRELTEAPLVMLATAVSNARVTVIGGPDFVYTSVIADCGDVDLPLPSLDGLRLETFRKNDTLWVEVQWQPCELQR